MLSVLNIIKVKQINIIFEKFFLRKKLILIIEMNNAINRNIEDKTRVDGSRNVPIKKNLLPIERWFL